MVQTQSQITQALSLKKKKSSTKHMFELTFFNSHRLVCMSFNDRLFKTNKKTTNYCCRKINYLLLNNNLIIYLFFNDIYRKSSLSIFFLVIYQMTQL